MPVYPGVIASASQAAAAALPTYVNHGTGTGGIDPAVDLAPPFPASIAIGDWLIVHGIVRAASAPSCAISDSVNWALWYDDQSSTSSFARQFIFARQYDGAFLAPTLNWGATGVTPAARARITAIRGTNGVREGAAVATANASPAIAIPPVTTLGANRLVLGFEAWTLTTTMAGDPAGTTGGTYVQRSITTTGGNQAGIVLVTANMAGTGTIANGVSTTTGTPNWVCRAFALQPG